MTESTRRSPAPAPKAAQWPSSISIWIVSKRSTTGTGTPPGDAVLRMVSRRVLQSIRRADVAARVGGDEFVVLLPGVRHRSDASRVGELIGQAVSEPIEFEGRELRVGPSIGVAIYPDDGRVTDALLKFADEEM